MAISKVLLVATKLGPGIADAWGLSAIPPSVYAIFTMNPTIFSLKPDTRNERNTLQTELDVSKYLSKLGKS